MPKQREPRHTTFLVAVAPVPGDPGDAPVYAVTARRADEALDIVRTRAEPWRDLAVVGSLSSRTAKAIRLGVGEARRV